MRLAKEAAEAADRAKSEFLGHISHEIRTPMTAILGFTDILLEDERVRSLPADLLDDLRTIKQNGDHLLDLINDILDLTKIEMGKLRIDREPVLPRPDRRGRRGVDAAQGRGQGALAGPRDRPRRPRDDPDRRRPAPPDPHQPPQQRDQVHPRGRRPAPDRPRPRAPARRPTLRFDGRSTPASACRRPRSAACSSRSTRSDARTTRGVGRRARPGDQPAAGRAARRPDRGPEPARRGEPLHPDPPGRRDRPGRARIAGTARARRRRAGAGLASVAPRRPGPPGRGQRVDPALRRPPAPAAGAEVAVASNGQEAVDLGPGRPRRGPALRLDPDGRADAGPRRLRGDPPAPRPGLSPADHRPDRLRDPRSIARNASGSAATTTSASPSTGTA